MVIEMILSWILLAFTFIFNQVALYLTNLHDWRDELNPIGRFILSHGKKATITFTILAYAYLILYFSFLDIPFRDLSTILQSIQFYIALIASIVCLLDMIWDTYLEIKSLLNKQKESSTKTLKHYNNIKN